MSDVSPSPAPAPAPAAQPTPAPSPAPAPAPSPTPDPQPAPSPAARTVAGGAADPQPGPQPPADWPEDWRPKLAGDDKKDLETLERLASPLDLWKQNKELRSKLSQREQKPALPDNATPEQVEAFRKEHKLPASADDYVANLALPDGVVVGEADKPLVADFAQFAHGKLWDQARMNEAVAWYYDLQDKQAKATEDADDEFHDACTQELGKVWGNEYNTNERAVGNLLAAMFPENIRNAILAARIPDDPEFGAAAGRMLGDSPLFMQALASASRQHLGAATVIPQTPEAQQQVGNRLAELKKLMGDYGSAYWVGAQAAQLQAEYNDLIKQENAARERAQAR